MRSADPGRVLVVTGANRGIGLHVARQAATAGAPVVMICRNLERGRRALATLDPVPGGHQLVIADLGEWESVRDAAETIRAGRPVRALVNNAAVLPPRLERNQGGVELQLAVNHLGHVLLTGLLLPKLLEGAPSRIVGVSSGSHRGPPVALDDPGHIRRPYRRLVAYQQSKLANLAFTLALARRLEGSGVEAVAIQPGVYATGLWERWTGLGPLARLVVPGPARGARHVLRLALPEPGDSGSVNGSYFRKGRPGDPSPAAMDVSRQEELLTWSLAQVGLDGHDSWPWSGEGRPTP